VNACRGERGAVVGADGVRQPDLAEQGASVGESSQRSLLARSALSNRFARITPASLGLTLLSLAGIPPALLRGRCQSCMMHT